MKSSRARLLVPVLTFAIMIIACEVALDVFNVSKFFLPRPTLILDSIIDSGGWLTENLWVTLYEAIVGFLLGTLLAIPIALSYLFFPSLEPVIVPLAITVRNIPFVAIAPILFIILGYGPVAKIVIVMLLSFFPVMANLTAGFKSVSRNWQERFYVCHATRWQRFWKLELPVAIPYFVAGMNISVSNAVIGAIVGELLGTFQGMGFVILMSISQYNMPQLMATVVLTASASMLLTWVVSALANVVFRRWLTQ